MEQKENVIISTLEDDSIRSRIFTIRGVQVMLDRDLAELYGVPTKRLNEQVKRNSIRFPANFMFPLNDVEIQDVLTGTSDETSRSRSQFATLKKGRGHNIKYRPNVFTEHGIIMLASVLKSEIAALLRRLCAAAYCAEASGRVGSGGEEQAQGPAPCRGRGALQRAVRQFAHGQGIDEVP